MKDSSISIKIYMLEKSFCVTRSLTLFIKIIEIINFKHTMWTQHVTEPPIFSQREFNRVSKRQLKSLKSNIELGLPLSRDFGDLTANKKREKTKIHME